MKESVYLPRRKNPTRDTKSTSHRRHIAVTSPSHRHHIAVTSPSHRRHIAAKSTSHRRHIAPTCHHIAPIGTSRPMEEVRPPLDSGSPPMYRHVDRRRRPRFSVAATPPAPAPCRVLLPSRALSLLGPPRPLHRLFAHAVLGPSTETSAGVRGQQRVEAGVYPSGVGAPVRGGGGGRQIHITYYLDT